MLAKNCIFIKTPKFRATSLVDKCFFFLCKQFSLTYSGNVYEEKIVPNNFSTSKYFVYIVAPLDEWSRTKIFREDIPKKGSYWKKLFAPSASRCKSALGRGLTIVHAHLHPQLSNDCF